MDDTSKGLNSKEQKLNQNMTEVWLINVKLSLDW
jgi:hypothetical protein